MLSLDSAPTEPARPISTTTGITNSVRQNETVEPTPSTTKPTVEKREGENRNQPPGASLAESQFYARTSTTPYLEKQDLNQVKPKPWNEEKKTVPKQELLINEPIDSECLLFNNA